MLDIQRFKTMIDEFSSTQCSVFGTPVQKRIVQLLYYNSKLPHIVLGPQYAIFSLEIFIILILSKDFIEISIYSPPLHCLYFVFFFLSSSCCKGMKTINVVSIFFPQQETSDFQWHFIWQQKIKKVMNSGFSMAFSVIAEMILSGQQLTLVVFFFMGHVLTDNIPQYSKKLQPLSNLDLLLTLRTHGFYTSRAHRNFQYQLFHLLPCVFHYV